MFNVRMTSAWTGPCVTYLRRIEGPVMVARPRHDQVDVPALANAGGILQRFGTPSA